jgi:GLPGLI family protein
MMHRLFTKSLTMAQKGLLLLLFCPAFAMAQKTEGRIDYTETVQMQINLPDGPEAEEMRKLIPKERALRKALYFNAKSCLYMDAPNPKADEGDLNIGSQDESGNNLQISFKMSDPENRSFLDLESGKSVESTEFFGRRFLIEEDIKKLNWKIVPEQRQIQGYLCQKAVLQDTSRKVIAWFTPMIPVSIGPGEFHGLPGAVLEIDANDGLRKIVADKVELMALEANTITKPDKGKAVGREEFKKIKEEKLKEMGATPGGNGSMKVIIRN